MAAMNKNEQPKAVQEARNQNGNRGFGIITGFHLNANHGEYSRNLSNFIVNNDQAFDYPNRSGSRAESIPNSREGKLPKV